MKNLKRWSYLLCTLFLLSIFFPSSIEASMPSEVSTEFSNAIEEQISNTVNYYHKNSSTVLDSLYMQKADVMKILETDDPSTEENEEKIEEYQADIVVGFVEFEQQKDTIFFFKKTEIYYYDLENDEFLTASNVFINEEVKDFFNSHVDGLGKHITPMSITIASVLILFSLLCIPLLILIFQHKGSNSHYSYMEENNYRG